MDPSGEEEQSVYDQPEDKPWYEDAWNSTKDFASEYGTKILDVGQVGLDVAGLVPGVGELADGANVLIYEARGDHLNAALSGAAMVPFAGWLSTGGKFVNKAVKYGDEAGGLINDHNKLINNIPKQIHHVATNKSNKFTQEFKAISDKYNLNLDSDWNKIEMPHSGRHPNEYHEFILDAMKSLDVAAKGETRVFLNGFNKIKEQVKNTPEMLRKAFWD